MEEYKKVSERRDRESILLDASQSNKDCLFCILEVLLDIRDSK